jgi:hypothetical protein
VTASPVRHEASCVVVVAALIALSMIGCGGTPSDGMEDKSVAQVLEEAAAAA